MSDIWTMTTAAEWQALAAEHGTPFYLFDADAVRARIRAVRDALHGFAQVYYAVKANPNLGLLRALRNEADGVDISSGGELTQALAAGFDAADMSFAGPAKTDVELDAAVCAGVGCISVESLREIDACAAVAERHGSRARITLRVNPTQVPRAYGQKMGGRALQFGIDEDALPEAVARVGALGAQLDLRGIHTYVGSQCFEPAAIVESTSNALRIAGELEQRSDIRCSSVNLGGGFGIASGTRPRELDLTALEEQLVPVLRCWHDSHPDGRLLFELGRFLTAKAGIYVTRVVDNKTSRGKAFVTCDGGLNHHLAAAGTFGAALRGNFPLCNLSRPQAEPLQCNIAGPSCNPTDLLGVEASVGRLQQGDLLGVPMSGSYGLTASPMLFLGRPTPVELVRSEGVIVVGRRSHALTTFN